MDKERIRKHLNRGLEDQRRRDLHARVLPIYGSFCVIAVLGTVVAVLHARPRAAALILVILGLSIAAFTYLSSRMRTSSNTERLLVALHTVVPVTFAAIVATTGGAASGALPLFATSAAYAGARFHGRRLGVIQIEIALIALIGCYFGGASTLRTHAENYIFLVATMISCAGVTSMLAAAQRTALGDSVIDPLTGLLNRRALNRRMNEIRAQASTTKLPVSAAVFDLDDFKRINDAHGHDEGDVVLRTLAHRLQAQARSFDMIYRLGGDEFVLLLPGSDGATATQKAQDMARAVSGTSAHGHTLSVSAGVATVVAGDPQALEGLIEDADRALYAAKAAGKNRVARATAAGAAGASTTDGRRRSRSPSAGLGPTPSGLVVTAGG